MNIILSKKFDLFLYFYYFIRNNNVTTVGIVNKSNIPYKILLDFSQENGIKLSSNLNKIEKVKIFFFNLY